MAGLEFSITATVNISDIVDIQSLNITWSDSSGNEQIGTSEVVGSGMSELNPGVSALDLTFSSLKLSQAGVYTIGLLISDLNGSIAVIQRSYSLVVQSKL